MIILPILNVFSQSDSPIPLTQNGHNYGKTETEKQLFPEVEKIQSDLDFNGHFFEEEEFYMQTIGEYFNVYRNPKAQKKRTAHTVQKGVKTGPLANIFADILDTDYLVFISIVGCSVNQKVYKKKGWAQGKMNYFGWIMVANSGEIIADVELQAKNNGLITEEKIQDLSLDFVKALKKKMIEIQN